MPGVDGGQARGVEELPAFAPRQCREGHRGVGGAERGGADAGHVVDVQGGGNHADGVDPGSLALVVRGGNGGVALHVLHRTHSGADRTQHIGHGLVALEVHEVVLVVGGIAVKRRHQPQGPGSARALHRGAGHRSGACEPGGRCRVGSGAGALGQRGGKLQAAVHGAGGLLVGHRVRRDERGESLVPAQAAFALGVQVHHRVPAAGNGQHIGVDGFDAALQGAVGVDAADGYRGQGAVGACSGVGDHRAGQDPDAARGEFRRANRGLFAGVDDGGHGGAPGQQVFDQGVGGIVRGGHHDLLADLDAVAVQVRAGGGGQHDAGAVVVLEDQRAFVRAGGQHDLCGADVPDAFAGHPGTQLAGQVVGAALDCQDVVGVVAAEGGGACQVGEFLGRVQG